ncbi:MAG TPA: NAD+ synthase, partial [Armatimonadota bacterium]|nr:NAD+ synthase [Armatimonadota bacterium]
FNAAAVLHNGHLAGVHHKRVLSRSGAFDETRYFQPGEETRVFSLGGVAFGVTIGEEGWAPDGPASTQCLLGGAQVVFNLSAAPFVMGQRPARERRLAIRAAEDACFLAYLNGTGGQDELVFDGGSVLLGPDGEMLLRAPVFAETLVVADLDLSSVTRARLRDPSWGQRRRARQAGGEAVERVILEPVALRPDRPPVAAESAPVPDRLEEVYTALVTGTRDYVTKNGFKDVVIGLSGGIDSAMVACIAVDALGKERVVGVNMPSVYSSEETRADARLIAENLGIRFLTIPIQETFEAYKRQLAEVFAGRKPDLTEENLQARIRANLLMALSNKFGYLVLSSGNKSEVAAGYATLYGDTAGAFSPIKDVPKTLVWALAEYRNTLSPVIPETTIRREPTAELRPDQKDTDSLPPYDLLDRFVALYVEEERSADEIIGLGYDEELVRRVTRMIDRAEYKRRQAAPGVKITARAFGIDRHVPLTHGYREL